MDKELMNKLSEITEEEQRLLSGNGIDMKDYSSSALPIIEKSKLPDTDRMISIRPHTRFADFPRHSHNYIEMMYMCSGKITHTVNDEDIVELNEGELLLLGRHSFHSISKARAEDIAVNFIMMPQFFDTALTMIGTDNALGRFVLHSLTGEGDDSPYLHFKVSDVLPVQNLVENMIYSLVRREPNRRKIMQNTMGLLLLELLNNTERLSLPKSQQHENKMVMEVIRSIEENYRDVTLSDLAEAYSVSSAYISRLVHEATGMTFTENLKKKRLQKAALFLRSGSMSVQEIVHTVGYENTSYFYRIFREEFGVGPTEYRKTDKLI